MTRVVGHALWYEGGAHDDNGYPIDVGGWVTRSGPGRAKCECGDLSEVLTSGAARRAWHKAHKAEVAK